MQRFLTYHVSKTVLCFKIQLIDKLMFYLFDRYTAAKTDFLIGFCPCRGCGSRISGGCLHIVTRLLKDLILLLIVWMGIHHAIRRTHNRLFAQQKIVIDLFKLHFKIFDVKNVWKKCTVWLAGIITIDKEPSAFWICAACIICLVKNIFYINFL